MVILLILGIIALALSGYLTGLSRIALNPFVAVQTWVAVRFQALQEFFNAPTDITRLRQRNAELEAENSRLQLQVIELQKQVSEIDVLSTLVEYARMHSESRYIAASVIGYDTSPFIRYVIINRGSDDGLRRGMPVVTNKGLVGQIAAVTAGAARIQLITDTASSVNVHLQKANTEAVVTGQVTGELLVNMIPQGTTVEPGDLVVTSGLGGNYPANLVLGQITSVHKRDFDLFQTASLQSTVDFTGLDIVLVITNFQPVDITPLVPETNP